MIKLPSLTSKNIITILEKKGFIFTRSKGSHRLFYNPITHRRVTVPFHGKDLPMGTLKEILKQAGLTSEDIID